jgi:hypothetical protein
MYGKKKPAAKKTMPMKKAPVKKSAMRPKKRGK